LQPPKPKVEQIETGLELNYQNKQNNNSNLSTTIGKGISQKIVMASGTTTLNGRESKIGGGEKKANE
jgi:hypothetical protein